MTAWRDHLPDLCRDDPECRLLDQLASCPELFAEISSRTGMTELALQAQLRKQFPEELVRSGLQLHQLRLRARGKFTRAEQMWFDRQGYEQSTAQAVARHKAARFPTQAEVWDLCSGIGSDALALAERGAVVAVDNRPACCWRTLANAAEYDVADQIRSLCVDLQGLDWPTGLVHIDPDRRAGASSRAVRLEDYQPGMDYLAQLMTQARGGAIKIGPASNFGGKFPQAEIELVSLDGECKEATVWFGELAGIEPYRATVLPSGATLAGHPLSARAEITPLQAWFYDPDPAVVRAGLVDLCAEHLAIHRLDDAEEYLTSERLVQSPFVSAFRVLAELSNNERELRAYLRKQPASAYEIKCRHIPVSAETLRKHLPRGDGPPVTVVIARIAGKARIILAERLAFDRPSAKVTG